MYVYLYALLSALQTGQLFKPINDMSTLSKGSFIKLAFSDKFKKGITTNTCVVFVVHVIRFNDNVLLAWATEGVHRSV